MPDVTARAELDQRERTQRERVIQDLARTNRTLLVENERLFGEINRYRTLLGQAPLVRRPC